MSFLLQFTSYKDVKTWKRGSTAIRLFIKYVEAPDAIAYTHKGFACIFRMGDLLKGQGL